MAFYRVSHIVHIFGSEMKHRLTILLENHNSISGDLPGGTDAAPFIFHKGCEEALFSLAFDTCLTDSPEMASLIRRRCPKAQVRVLEDESLFFVPSMENTMPRPSFDSGLVHLIDALSKVTRAEEISQVLNRFSGELGIRGARLFLRSPEEKDAGTVLFPGLEGYSRKEALLLLLYPVQEDGILTALLGLTACEASFEELALILHLVSHEMKRIRKTELLTAKNAELTRLYTHDSLTKLHNRFALEKGGRALFEEHLRQNGVVSICFVDVDHLKYINDTFGHVVGDQVLQKTADVIHAVGKSHDLFTARFGGDEFILIGAGDDENLRFLLQERISKIRLVRPAHSDFADPAGYVPSISIGRIEARNHISFEECIAAADQRMYERKRELRA